VTMSATALANKKSSRTNSDFKQTNKKDAQTKNELFRDKPEC
jgi:hypothetical protein